MTKFKKVLTIMLVFVLVLTLSPIRVNATKKKKVKLNKSKLSMYIGKSYKLKLKNNKKKVKWSSSKKKVASVSSKGKVKAKKQGSCKIIAKVGKKKFVCKVTVKKKVSRSTNYSSSNNNTSSNDSTNNSGSNNDVSESTIAMPYCPTTVYCTNSINKICEVTITDFKAQIKYSNETSKYYIEVNYSGISSESLLNPIPLSLYDSSGILCDYNTYYSQVSNGILTGHCILGGIVKKDDYKLIFDEDEPNENSWIPCSSNKLIYDDTYNIQYKNENYASFNNVSYEYKKTRSGKVKANIFFNCNYLADYQIAIGTENPNSYIFSVEDENGKVCGSVLRYRLYMTEGKQMITIKGLVEGKTYKLNVTNYN